LVKFRVHEFIRFAEWAGVPIAGFLAEHLDIDQGMAVDNIAERLPRRGFPDQLRQALAEANWEVWTRALAVHT
jgi:hypothetical protein